MMKLTALNEVIHTENEEECANLLTKEAQEQLALSEYNRALQLLVEKQKEEALNVLKQLLNTELLDDIKQPEVRDGRNRPMLSLKYSCFKNVASIYAELKNYHDAFYNYCEAASLDDSDVMLWYKIGITAMELSDLETACLAFKQGLKRNCGHWPCLDNIITVLYVIPDYMNCLLYISVALEKDSSYLKGLVLRQQILKDNPSFQECYRIYNKSWDFDPPFNANYNQMLIFTYLDEANKLRKKWLKSLAKDISKKYVSDLFLNRKLVENSWLDLGKSLIDMYNYINNNNLNFLGHIVFDSTNWSNSIITDPLSDTVDEECLETKEESVKKICCFDANKDIAINPLLKDNYVSIIPDSYVIEMNETESRSYTSDIQITEDSVTTPLVEIYGRELDTNNSNSFEDKEDSLNYLTEYDNVKNSGTNVKCEEKEKSRKIKKRRRSSLCFLTQWAWSSSSTKRTSRARTAGRKECEKDGDLLEDTLKRIFPPTLLKSTVESSLSKKPTLNCNEYLMQRMDLEYLTKEKNNFEDIKIMEKIMLSNAGNEYQMSYFGSHTEDLDVTEFIKENNGKYNIIIVMMKYIEFLCTKWNDKWPDVLPDLYIQTYLCIREHVPHAAVFLECKDNNILKLNEEIILLFCELFIDKWLAKECISSPSSLNKLSIGIPSEDLGSIIFSKTANMCEEGNADFILRLLWLKANIFLYQGNREISLLTLEMLLNYTKKFQVTSYKPRIKLVNCKYNSIVSEETARSMLVSIQRGKNISEIKRLYREKKYNEVSCILKDTFDLSKETNPFFCHQKIPIGRVEHLQILLDSLWQLQQFEDCYVWAEACLNEAWHHYLNIIDASTTTDERNKWMKSVIHSLEKMHSCVEESSGFIVKYLPKFRQSRLIQNLIHIVCHQLDVVDNTSSTPVESVLPWILLHSILLYEEDKQRARSETRLKRYKIHTMAYSESDEDDEDIPASITILLKAHEFLGRHGWCCINEGKLLLFIIKLIIPKLHYPLYRSIKRKLKEPLEQIIYCLYGHPAKLNSGIRSKPKYLDEHVKNHMTVNWEVCPLLYEFYRPQNLPSFESKRVDSINSDTVILFKKMCTLIPQDSDPTQITDDMNAYLLGTKQEIPTVKKSLSHQISYIYYLIADHYFKAGSSQSWISAIKYYILDLCLHPNALNSWAGLAMSTSTLMETWLNNFQPNINEQKYLAKARVAQRSYQHAIDLAPSHLTIWTEYGNFLYTVHSFCSRLLKQESDSLNMERFRILETRKEEMLDKAKDCFSSANNIYIACQGIDEPQDERWLYQYMLAKIAEKKNEEPPVFLKHYSKASALLYQNHALYPKRINHKNPQNLSIEALEVYYRIHASILKYLEQHDGKPLKRSLATVLEENLINCLRNPFVTHSSNIQSVFNDQTCHHDLTKLITSKQSDNKRETENLIHDSKTKVLNKNIISVTKFDSRKRQYEEPIITSDTKRMKLSNVSHLQLMQDVVALIDDLITKVCDSVCDKQTKCKFESCVSKSDKNYLSESWNLITEESETSHLSQPLTESCVQSDRDVCVEKDQLRLQDYNNSNKITVKWLQSEDLTPESFQKMDKGEDKKKYLKVEGLLSRRGSQESTTTTTQTSTTETNNSSSSSSEETSTTNDSSNTSSSSDSDSDSAESDAEKRKKILIDNTCVTEAEMMKLTDYCLAGLEQCVLRFPEHYKSIYRLAYFFFNNKRAKNIMKCKQLLLGIYDCQFYPKQTIQGLFSERKNANFFNGIWRIPIHEIDRPGSFASHMSRCILLLMQVLKETGDSRMLTELCIQLKKIPDTDKKYLRDGEREQLSCQALTLCLQSLRSKIKSLNMHKVPINVCNMHTDEQVQVLLDIYYTYQNIKNISEYEILELPKIRKLLEEAYVTFSINQPIHGNVFEQAKEYCRQRIRANKIGTTNIEANTSSRIVEVGNLPSVTNIDRNTTLNIHGLYNAQNQKSQKVLVSARPRGRPPGITKCSQMISNDSKLYENQYNHEYSQTTHAYIPNSSNLASNSRLLNPFLEPNVLTAMLRSGLNTDIDAPVKYFNEAGAYQDILRQYQNNLNAISSINTSYRQKCNASSSSLTDLRNSLISTKERSEISITPVSGSMRHTKVKSGKSITANSVQNDRERMTAQVSKSIQITPTSQVSILKPPHCQQHISQSLASKSQAHIFTNSSPKKVCAGLNQLSLPVSNQTIAIASDTSTPACTSLQHKLLSKKQNQNSHRSITNTTDPTKKLKPIKSVSTNSYINLLNNVAASYAPSNLSSTTVNAMSSFSTTSNKSFTNTEKPIKFKCSNSRNSSNYLQNTSSTNAFSVLSQLQQHSHLEIIPQSNFSLLKPGIDITKTAGNIVENKKLPDSSNLLNTDSVTVYELPRRKPKVNLLQTSQTKNQDKCKNDNVEIITLDD